MQLNKDKLELIKKIVNANLSKLELKAIKDKAEEIIDRRPIKKE